MVFSPAATSASGRAEPGHRTDLAARSSRDHRGRQRSGGQLWTFQTAFRWIYPSVLADGQWSDSLAALIEFHRSTAAPLGPVQPKINKALWDAVVGGTHLSTTGAVTANAADPLAAYRPP